MYVCFIIFSGDGSVSLLQEFAELTNQYAVLQRKASATALTKVTLNKVEQLREAAEKLAVDTDDKIRRIAGISSLYVALWRLMQQVKLYTFNVYTVTTRWTYTL